MGTVVVISTVLPGLTSMTISSGVSWLSIPKVIWSAPTSSYFWTTFATSPATGAS